MMNCTVFEVEMRNENAFKAEQPMECIKTRDEMQALINFETFETSI